MIPKAELHVHLEGSAPPALIKKLALRNGVKMADRIYESDQVFVWNDFLDFLDVYEMASRAIRKAVDYRDITYDYLARSSAEGVIYTELMSSPEHAAKSGLSYVEHLEGVVTGIEEAKRDFGIEARIIIACVRHFGADNCLQTVKSVIQNPHPLVVGIGLGGDEAGYPAGQFAKVFALADDAGLACTAHAGEMAGPASVWEAIDSLPVTRIGHGVRSIEDPHLVEALVKRNITLEVSPGSNIALGVYPDFASHPFLQLKAAGVKLTLSSDDPPYFATTVGQEYDNAKRQFGLTDEDLLTLTRNAINSAFIAKETKEHLLKRVRVG